MAITKEVRLRALAEMKTLGIETAARNAGVAVRTLQSWARPDYEENAERKALRKKFKEILPQAEDRIMGYLAEKDLLVCSMTDDELFDLSAFINQEVADVVRKVYDALEKKALQMRPVIITAPRRTRNKIAPNDDQLWLIPPSQTSNTPPVKSR